MPNTRKGEEYPTKSGIIVSPKINPSGSRAYRVDIPATITGKSREQRQFPTKKEAQTYASERYAEITRFGHAAFTLTARQREDALRAIEILKGYNLTLETVAQVIVRQTPQLQTSITVNALRTLFLQAPGKRKKKVLVRRTHTVRSLKWRTAQFAERYGNQQASEISLKHVQEWFRTLTGQSPVSLNNHRRALHAMFSFAVTEGYCIQNPVSKIPLFVVPDTTPSILTVDQARRLITVAAETNETLGMLGYIGLGLFAGLRRAEIERLDWSAVKWERRMVTVDASIAKTGSIRNVALSDNAMAWLRLCRRDSGRVVPRNFNRRSRQLRTVAEIEKWDGNELRHSFASYHFDLHQNGPLTAAQLGHSSGCQLLFEHYRSLVPLGEGEKFFEIRPPTGSPLELLPEIAVAN